MDALKHLRVWGGALAAVGLLSGAAVWAQDEPLPVVATYSILGDWVANVGGDAIALTVLVGPDGDSHVYEPTPSDAVALAEAAVIFENGLEFETWLDELYEASGSSAVRVAVSDGIEPMEFAGHDHGDEHDHEHGDGEAEHADEHSDEHAEGEAGHDHGEPPTTLDAWQGAFVSASSFGRDAFQPAWDAVMATTPELSADDIAAYWDATSQTLFERIRFEDDAVTFGTGDSETTCTYAFVETHAIPQVPGETWSIFETADPACTETYQYLLLNPLHAAEEGSIPHFHMSYGAGDLETVIDENGAFFPSMYPAGTTVDALIPAYEANARSIGLYMAGVVGVEAALTEEETAAMQAATEEAEHDHEHGDEHSDEHGHEHGEFDPHVWHDVANARIMVANIRDALIAADPANTDLYTANAEAYLAQLDELETYVEAQVALIPEDRRVLITTHDTFGYFAQRYGFTLSSVIASISTESADPSAADIATLIEEIRAFSVPAIFGENITNPDLMQRVADEAGVALAPTLYTDALGQPGTEGGTYLDMMRYNIDTITAALTQ
jgi:ABC-type Zn uptake system ZnuABC Zn-binding protein ZnuA